MGPLFHSYRLNGISRTKPFSLPLLRAEKRGGGGEVALLGTLRSSFELLIGQARDYVPIYRVPSSPEEAALLPLGSYSSYRLVGKMY